MTLFRGLSWIPPSGPLRPPPAQHAGARATRRSGSSADQGHSDTEWRLEQELATLLSRKPARRPRNHPLSSYADIEPPEPPARLLTSGAHLDEPDSNERLITEDQEDPNHRPRLQSYNTNWLRTARRLHRNHSLRLVASWSITIVVGSFIVTVAAVILFGPPGGKFAFRKNLEVVAETGLETGSMPMDVSETRWRLD